MNVLSLFDGISCGQVALERCGISVDTYFASEIDADAMKITEHNYPNTVFVGDVRHIHADDLPKIDLLIGGSPCTDLSVAGRQRGMGVDSLDFYLQLKSEGFPFVGQSYLFWEYARLLNELKPKYYLLENVRTLKKWEDLISNTLKVLPVCIDSALVSAQTRIRNYWTNIPNVSIPKNRDIHMSDILIKNQDWNLARIVGRKFNKMGRRIDTSKNADTIQCLEVPYNSDNKIGTLVTFSKSNVLTPLDPGQYRDAYGHITGERLPFRHLEIIECERLQTLPDGYTDCGVSKSSRYKAIANGWTVDVVAHILNNLRTDTT